MKWQDKGNLQRQQFLTLKMTNDEFVLEKFREMNETEHDPLIDKMISDYELSLWLQKSRSGGLNQAFPHKWAASKESDSTVNVEDIVLFAFQLERDYIQTMFENGRISRESAKEMRKNISLLELQLRDEENSIF